MIVGNFHPGFMFKLVTFPRLMLIAVILVSGCASNHDVDQVESRVSIHQDEIGGLKSEIAVVEQKRIELHDQVIDLKLSESANASDVENVVDELNQLDERYVLLNAQLNKVSRNASKNDDAIQQLQLQEERRQEIIRRHNDRWESINASTDSKLSALEESLDDQLIANENEGGLINEEIKK
jgi:DNA anti-recombination protein RmuC